MVTTLIIDIIPIQTDEKSKCIMEKKYTIAIAGTGYVGLSIVTLLSQHHNIWQIWIDDENTK